METLLEILNDIDDTVNWEDETALIDDRILDSFGVISLISELEDSSKLKLMHLRSFRKTLIPQMLCGK